MRHSRLKNFWKEREIIMKTAPITVTSRGTGVGEALALTEQIGKDCRLAPKSILHLRLLGEELFGMLRGIAGEIEADYWIDCDEKKIDLHLKSTIHLTQEMKEQLLAASSSGSNEAAKSFMGKIRVMIANALLSSKEAIPFAVINAAAASPAGGFDASAGSWSMLAYKNELKKKDVKETTEAWDELEKSIVANIADDVRVKIVGNAVEIIVAKAF